ncbi:MAG TPA: single-stranded DNA-binding protein, partial [Bacteroidales bacterium]|nr:single-stranded DNA-binding protein [Bacteroidales bacterium]
ITQWFNCSYFTEKTTLLDYLKKGTKVLIIGNFFVTEYLSNDNTKKMSIDVIASSLEILKFKDSDDATDGKNQSS